MTPCYVPTGCHGAVSLPFHKCERCVKRCPKGCQSWQEPYLVRVCGGSWLASEREYFSPIVENRVNSGSCIPIESTRGRFEGERDQDLGRLRPSPW